MRAEISIMLKQGVLDPEGEAIGHALGALGFKGVGTVRKGKRITLELDDTDEVSARARVTEMCEKLLANTVIESYEIKLS